VFAVCSVLKDYELHFMLFNHTFTHSSEASEGASEGVSEGVRQYLDPNGVVVERHLVELADIAVAVEADFYLGHLRHSLTSELVNMLQRTRGDGGSDFHSIDEGSSWEGF
jgi:hypothetical protein